jgi:isopenicillin-N N-acyltransferase-like protein
LEITPDSVETLKSESNGMLVHTNHCVHPSLASNNKLFANRIYGQSFDRKARAQVLLEQRVTDGKISISDAQALLSDHQDFPTSICRHPNNDHKTGWQRSVISIIVEPSLRRMHISNGNPCKNPYETYRMK